MKHKNLTLGQVEAVLNKLGGTDGALKFLRNELSISEPEKSWREKNGIIYFSVLSDGTTGAEWVERLGRKGLLGKPDWFTKEYLQKSLLAREFIPTNGVITEVAILKSILFNYIERKNEIVRRYASENKLIEPTPEVACLIMEKFSKEDFLMMGLTDIKVMHKPFSNSDRPDRNEWIIKIRPMDEYNVFSTNSACEFDILANFSQQDAGFAFSVSSYKCRE
jgi:hypothetical protein